ncbi:hypothetical protein NDA16_001145 [Ustilago loliicola]|nr:hypothetical protein NDA16_001145 [Ustilago loliicola]
MVNGTSTGPSPSPVPSPAVNDATPQSPSNSPSSSAATSSATSLTALTEQLSLITTQLRAVDLDKSRINAHLDRLDLRSTLLHLVSDRVPTLPTIGSTAGDTPDPIGDDEEMPDEPAKKSKKKKGSAKKSKSTTEIGGPHCGYDQRLHWDDAQFDLWAHNEPGRSILAYDQPLDGVLDDASDAEAGARVVCGIAKRKCRRHLDWSNLCEVSLDAEKASLNADSRILTQTKLELVELKQKFEEEMQMVKQLMEQQARRQKGREEERDRDLAKAVASQGTRRGVV